MFAVFHPLKPGVWPQTGGNRHKKSHVYTSQQVGGSPGGLADQVCGNFFFII